MLRNASINALAAIIILAAASAPAAAAETGLTSFAFRSAPVSSVEVSCIQPGPNGKGCTDPRGIRKSKDKIMARGEPQADGCKSTNTTKECRGYIFGNIKPSVREK